MMFAARNGVRLHFDSQGAGVPLVFLHEFAGDARSWEPHVRTFSATMRCITFNARGYPPSSVPSDDSSYSVQAAVDDIGTILDATDTQRAFLVGASMGGYSALQYAIQNPDRVMGLLIFGVGGGSRPSIHEAHRQRSLANANRFLTQDIEAAGRDYANGGSRRLLKRKNPAGFLKFEQRCMELSSTGAGLTMRNIQGNRQSLETMEKELSNLTVPVLIMVGDEDDGCLETDIFLKRTLPAAGLCVVPLTGHAIAQEEPEFFDATLKHFIETVQQGNWSKSG
ncbi:alpha/beta hydrolase [Hydrogenophaga sp. 2FB]|uniref:alpha/beta fold hydrolase n=1 Tax=Hydrogenophaga sp. 2FB TaxID=2502187 RepID=UPI001485000A|nr:alpha/beta hydrolase [Hydrogenophaga sp. 2FB]